MYKKVDEMKHFIFSSLCFVILLSIVMLSLTIDTNVLFVPQKVMAQNITHPQTTTRNFLTYENNTLGIKIQYPSDWIKTQERSVYGFIVSFRSPLPNESGKAASALGSLSIDVMGMYSKTSLKDYIFSYTYALKKYHPEVKINESNSTSLAGNPGYKMLFTDGKGIRIMQFWTLKGDKIYHIIYPIAEFISLPVLQKMIDSFQITKSFS
jgi:hypothetical protein